MKRKSFVSLSVILCACANLEGFAANDWFSGKPLALHEAHQAYVEGDFRNMAIKIKGIFERGEFGPQVQKNAMMLLESAHSEAGSSGIPADWKLPEELRLLQLDLVRRQLPDSVEHALKLFGRSATTAKEIAQLSIVNHRGEVVLDKNAGVGEWWVSPKPEEQDRFELTLEDLEEPQPEGLYFVHAEFRNGRTWSAWFLLSGVLASSSPKLHAPTTGEIVTSATPTIEWDDFRSPEFQPSEKRSLWLGIGKSHPYQSVFSLWRRNPKVSKVTVDRELENGKHSVILSYKERKKFGEMWLGRGASTVRPFFVRADESRSLP